MRHVYVVVDTSRFMASNTMPPTKLRVALAEQNIESRPLWKPMHLQPVFAGAPAVVDGTAERMFRTGLSLPSSSALTDAQLDRVMGAILAFVRGDRGRD